MENKRIDELAAKRKELEEKRKELEEKREELEEKKELVEEMQIKNIQPTSKILKIGGFGLTLVGLTGIALVSRQAQIHPETITALDFATLMISGGEAALGAVLYGHDNMSTKKKRKK